MEIVQRGQEGATVLRCLGRAGQTEGQEQTRTEVRGGRSRRNRRDPNADRIAVVLEPQPGNRIPRPGWCRIDTSARSPPNKAVGKRTCGRQLLVPSL